MLREETSHPGDTVIAGEPLIIVAELHFALLAILHFVNDIHFKGGRRTHLGESQSAGKLFEFFNRAGSDCSVVRDHGIKMSNRLRNPLVGRVGIFPNRSPTHPLCAALCSFGNVVKDDRRAKDSEAETEEGEEVRHGSEMVNGEGPLWSQDNVAD
jgi:hypothetical protein